MSRLQVYTARISSRDPDRFDVTRKSGGEEGTPFAPSWAILRPALDARREADRLGEGARNAARLGHGAASRDLRRQAVALDAEAWSAYVPAYLAEMRTSYRANRAAWERLLARRRVVLVCYCTDSEHCHRAILRSRILPALGAVDRGEIGEARRLADLASEERVWLPDDEGAR